MSPIVTPRILFCTKQTNHPHTTTNHHHSAAARPLSVHNPRELTTTATTSSTNHGYTSSGRIEYEPYKRRAMSTLSSPTSAMSTSMYEVFNWGYANDSSPAQTSNNNHVAMSSTPFRTGKRMHFSIAGPQINIDDPPQPAEPNNRSTNCSSGTGGGGGGARKGHHGYRETMGGSIGTTTVAFVVPASAAAASSTCNGEPAC